MAHPDRRRAENTEGLFFVDSTCIDCDTCRWMAPETFTAINGQSAVYHQPTHERERYQAALALVACPTASIGTLQPLPDIKNIRTAFPISLEDPVYHCGYHSEKSFGAASYFIQRAEGNVLVDSPRLSSVLFSRLEALGGIKYLFLTHSDDVAEHALLRERFGCERIIHAGDAQGSLTQAEILIRGQNDFELAPDLRIIPTPGHTRGSSCLLFANRFLFTGDHLAFSERLQHLYAFRSACWYSWERQIESMERLMNHDFAWVLPGHGRRFSPGGESAHASLRRCIDWMKGYDQDPEA